jgi:hypothetical protein
MPAIDPLRAMKETGHFAAMQADSAHPEQVRLALPNGDAIVLIGMLAKAIPADEANRNVYRVDSGGAVLWQIQAVTSTGDREPFTNVYFDDAGGLKAYCWNGGEYPVDADTGALGRGILVK